MLNSGLRARMSEGTIILVITSSLLLSRIHDSVTQLNICFTLHKNKFNLNHCVVHFDNNYDIHGYNHAHVCKPLKSTEICFNLQLGVFLHEALCFVCYGCGLLKNKILDGSGVQKDIRIIAYVQISYFTLLNNVYL